MVLSVFDIDLDLQVDNTTRDLKELYDDEAINQSIDIWISVPYRIGVGYTSSLIGLVFTDIGQKTDSDIADDIESEFERNYQLLKLNSVQVESDENNRKIFVKIDWRLKDYPLAGTYQRYWEK